MHKITLFQDKSPKITPHPLGLDARAFGARYSAPRLRLKDDLCFRLLLRPDIS